MTRKIVLGITQGDTNGIGYEVIIKALSDAGMMIFTRSVFLQGLVFL